MEDVTEDSSLKQTIMNILIDAMGGEDKLSTIPLLISRMVNKIMKFKRPCEDNPQVMDDWNVDDEIETLIRCNNDKKEVKRY